jgi:hypothetical protein
MEMEDHVRARWLGLLAALCFAALLTVAWCDDSAKNSDPPPKPPASIDTLYLKATVIDESSHITIIKYYTCLRDTHPEATGNLVCLDENGDVVK